MREGLKLVMRCHFAHALEGHEHGPHRTQRKFCAQRRRPLASPVGAALLMVVLIAAFFVLREHWGHIAGSWPYLLLPACPVMHLFHRHGGHGPRTDKE
jgi:hypothetical protein